MYLDEQVSYVHCVTPIPEGLDSAAAASLLCAVSSYYSFIIQVLIPWQGLTVYRALKHSETNPGDWVVLPGAGGGLGHLGTYADRHEESIVDVD
jgi:propanol-preferring alcohol dehydrogenase